MFNRQGKRVGHGELLWRSKDYPLHRCAMIGDAEGIKQLIAEGWTVTQKDAGSAAPIHHAALYDLFFFLLLCILTR